MENFNTSVKLVIIQSSKNLAFQHQNASHHRFSLISHLKNLPGSFSDRDPSRKTIEYGHSDSYPHKSLCFEVGSVIPCHLIANYPRA